MTRVYSGPAIYRWAVFTGKEIPTAVYIGETENLARRLNHYVNPGPKQSTNIRLNRYLVAEVGKGSKIELHTLNFLPFQVNGIPISAAQMEKVYVRRMIENLLLSLEDTMHCRVLNRIMDQSGRPRPEEIKAVRHYLRGLSLEDGRALFESVGIKETDQP